MRVNSIRHRQKKGGATKERRFLISECIRLLAIINFVPRHVGGPYFIVLRVKQICSTTDMLQNEFVRVRCRTRILS